METLQLKSGMRCAKYMLLTVCVMFAITAILLIMVGSTIQALFSEYDQFLDGQFFSPPALLIATGFIMLLVTMLGAYGALRESVMLINLYGLFLFFVFILEIAAAITAFALPGEVSGILNRTLHQSVMEYEHNENIQTGVDMMQMGLECCGVDSPNDWRDNWTPLPNITDPNQNAIEVPRSCCYYQTYYPNQTMICEQIFPNGCLPRMSFIIMQSNMLVATGAITVAFVQLLGVICAFMLAKTLRRNKSLREARRWQLQQSLSVLIAGDKAMATSASLPAPMNGYTQLEKSEHSVYKDPITYTATSPSVN